MARKDSKFHISWMTISYRSVVLTLVCALTTGYAVLYFIFPNSYSMRWVNDLGDRIVASLDSATRTKPGAVGPQQAHFTAIDGTVKVKKATSNVWTNASYDLPLEKGDVVQTSSEGMAKLVFYDGTNYTVKKDSLIVIEENSANASQQTNVAVQVTSGNVNLSTASYSAGSRSAVIVAGASAAIGPESAAVVQNDPRADKHEILVKKGTGEVTRGKEKVVLTDYEKVSFKSDSGHMAKAKEIGPPTLIAPANMSPVFASHAPIAFSWAPVTASHGYRLRISRTPYFSSNIYDRIVPTTDVRVAGLKEGNYYWIVTTVDIDGRQSVESERNQFTVVNSSPQSAAIPLELQPLVQHGHLVEVRGKTDVSARVMVNGQDVPMVKSDGSFSFLTPPLPAGENLITISVQNAKGAVRTEQRKVVVD